MGALNNRHLVIVKNYTQFFETYLESQWCLKEMDKDLFKMPNNFMIARTGQGY